MRWCASWPKDDYATDDVIPCLSGPENPVDLPAYRDMVLERFGNDAIRDTNQRVTADSFSKIPGFILPTIRDRLARNESIDSVAVLPALFLEFLKRWHAEKLPFQYHDQSMDPKAAHAIVQAEDPVKACVPTACCGRNWPATPAWKLPCARHWHVSRRT